MSTKPLVISLFALAALVAACTGSSDEDVPPADIVAQSRQNFSQVESFRARWAFPAPGGEDFSVLTEAGFQSGDLVYASMSFAGDGAAELEVSELVFIDPDLYLHRSDGQWFVLSPWNQGTRPDELSEFDPNDLVADYRELAAQLSDIEQLDDEIFEGESYLRYIGSMDLKEFDPDAPSGQKGTVGVQLLLDRDDYLPRTVRIITTVKDEDGFSRTEDVTQEFFDYNEPVTPPERPADVRTWRDLQLPDATCIGDQFAGCLEAQALLQATGACAGPERRICLVPLGQISPELVQHLVGHYRDTYGLAVEILTPMAVPAELADPLREQVDAATLIGYMGGFFPEPYGDENAVLIGITPLDLYNSTSHFRYVFGVKGDVSDPKASVSSFRMNPEAYSEPADQELFFSRYRKLLTKYVGLLYYGLPPSEDPKSPMFDSILSPTDLDRMEEPLPVGATR